jgi:natural product precursor
LHKNKKIGTIVLLHSKNKYYTFVIKINVRCAERGREIRVSELNFRIMKKLNRLKMTQLSKADLEARQMNAVRGGTCCGCDCHGPSSTYDNQNANAHYGYDSIGGNVVCWCWVVAPGSSSGYWTSGNTDH